MTKKLTTQEFIKRSNIIWNNYYNYTESIYYNSSTKIKIICPKHGIFYQLPSNHYKYGCKKCSYENNKFHRNKLLLEKSKKTFIEKSNKIHNYEYNYEKSIYKNSTIKLIVTCLKHGDFETTPNNHLRNRKCPKCANITRKKSNLKSKDLFLDKLNIDFKNKYDYSHIIWNGSSSKINILCPKHGFFKIYPYEHLKGKGCYSCNNQFSKMSIKWLEYMEIKNNNIIIHALNKGEYKIPKTRFKVDGFCKKTNTVYEFHGDFWHGNPNKYNLEDINPVTKTKYKELYNKTLFKKEYITSLGYNYNEIWESDWLKFEKCIKILQNNYLKNRFL